MRRPRLNRCAWLNGVALVLHVAGAFTAQAFPESVRYGYSNCSSCHVSPTGGGALTAYGREAAGEFLSTWGKPGEMAALQGAVQLPEGLAIGGDVRGMALYRENQVLKEKWAFPMQADAEASYRLPLGLTVGASFGLYDQDAQLRRAYLMANLNDYFYARVGRFFPAYGLLVPDHTSLIRKGLGFNQGRETLNVELGMIGEIGEIIVDPFVRESAQELSSEEKGVSARAAAYIGGRSQVGLSALSLNGTVWRRHAVGAFAAVGFTKAVYLLAEADLEEKKPVDAQDASTPASTRVLTYSKVGWEVTRGLHIQGLYESAVNIKGTFDPRQTSWGPAIQWFPRPHWELLGQVQAKLNDDYDQPKGYFVSFMGHYYL